MKIEFKIKINNVYIEVCISEDSWHCSTWPDLELTVANIFLEINKINFFIIPTIYQQQNNIAIV